MLIKKILLIWGLGLCLFAVSFASAENPPPLMHVDEIRPGMKGIGKTVFSGTTIEEFDVEIIAVLKNQTPQGDAIMAKVTGGPIPLEHSGVIAGMSGSPVYIDGKLIGAVAFIPELFPKEPMIAGITPIHEMIRDATRTTVHREQKQTTLASIPDMTYSSAQPYHFVPIQTPVIISGADPRGLPYLEKELASLKMFPVQGGGVSQAIAQDADTTLNPGSAVGVQLIRGDMDVNAVGTVTYRDGDHIIAFGHPMLFAGNVNFPMAASYVQMIVSNQIFSFKIASSLETVGTITQDRRTGISGMVGQFSKMVPLDVTIRDHAEGTQPKQYAFEIINHPLLMPSMMGFAGLSALFDAEKLWGEATVQTQITIALKDQPPLIIEDMITGNQNLPIAVFGAFAPVNILIRNSFEPITLEHISLDLTVKEAIQSAEIVGARVQNNYVRPGETVDVTISLRPYGKELTTVTESIQIPENVRQESLQLLIGDTNVTSMFEVARAATKFQPQSLTQLITLLNEQISQNNIVLSLLQLKPGAVVQGAEFPSPPVSMMSIMSTTGRSSGKNSMTRGRILMRQKVPTQYVISGFTTLELIVDHSDQRFEESTEEPETPIEGESTP